MNILCGLGFHSVPSNYAFEAMGAAFQGGLCTRCRHLKQGEFLGNLWDEEEDKGGVIVLKTTTGEAYARAFSGYEYHSIYEETPEPSLGGDEQEN